MADNFEFYKAPDGEVRVKLSDGTDVKAVHVMTCMRNLDTCFENSEFESPANQLSQLGIYRSKPDIAIFNRGSVRIKDEISIDKNGDPFLIKGTNLSAIKVVPPGSDIHVSESSSTCTTFSSKIIAKIYKTSSDIEFKKYESNFSEIVYNDKYKKKLSPGDHLSIQKLNLPSSSDLRNDIEKKLGRNVENHKIYERSYYDYFS